MRGQRQLQDGGRVDCGAAEDQLPANRWQCKSKLVGLPCVTHLLFPYLLT
jgi:hypothetical protein